MYPKPGNIQIGQQTGYYITKKYIGGGAFGSVWEGYHIRNPHHKYAIKKVDMLACTKKGKGANNLSLIKNEVITLKTIKPLCAPNIVTFVDFIEEPTTNIFYIIMELVKGTQLKQLPCAFISQNIKNIISQVATGLNCLHKLGLVHRDIKPENLIMDKHMNVVIVDLGLACKEISAKKKTRLREPTEIEEKMNVNTSLIMDCIGRVGTAGYQDPVMMEKGISTTKSDIYSFGVSLYRLLIGHRPKMSTSSSYYSTDSTSAGQIQEEFQNDVKMLNNMPNISKDIKTLIISMLNPFDRHSRPSSDDILKMVR